jgi:hypothetical protein
MSDDILDEQLFGPNAYTAKKWWVLLVVHFTLFGTGLLYTDKTLKRSLIYLFCAAYAWGSYVNVFVKFNYELSEFHNRSLIGASTVFAGWGIAYMVGGIDALITLRIRKKQRYQ